MMPRGLGNVSPPGRCVTDEAYTRLAAAQLLIEEGRSAEADVQLQRALPFYRAVRARRYVRLGESLLAASA